MQKNSKNITVISQVPQQKYKALDLYFESLRRGDLVSNIFET